MVSPAELYEEQTCTSNIASTSSIDPVVCTPRISFSADFLDDDDDDSFISISPSSLPDKEETRGDNNTANKNVGDFEFLSSHNISAPTTMLSADELFFEGKLLPYWQMHHAERLTKINLESNSRDNQGSAGVQKEVVGGQDQRAPPSIRATMSKEEPRIWFTDDDPSPRPPKCTVLWKELLRLKKQRPHTSTLSPSSSSSSSSSSGSMGDAAAMEDGNGKEGGHESFKEKQMRRIKKGLERTKSANSIGIRPMVNVPVCHQTQRKSSSLPPPFPIKRGSAMVVER